MRGVGAIAAVLMLLTAAVAGCGSGSGGTTTVVRTVTSESQASIRELVLAHQGHEGPRREAGLHEEGVNGCRSVGGGRVKTIPLRSETADCFRVAPDDRILFVNATGTGSDDTEPNPVEISLGDYEASIDIGGAALFPARVGTYLRPGLHLTDSNAIVQRPSIMVLPEGCSISDTKPGESLCFARGAPSCRGSELSVHAGRGGGAAGTVYQHFLVVNRSDRTCAVSGFPRVVAVDAKGGRIGAPIRTEGRTTTDSGNHPRTIALEPGAAAAFEMNSGTAVNYPPSTCRPRKAAALRVSIPSSDGKPQLIPYRFELCASGESTRVGRIE